MIDITITTAMIAGAISYFYNVGLREQANNTEQWQRELNALIEREKRKEDEEDRRYKDKDNEDNDR
jgi:predicted secreted protein